MHNLILHDCEIVSTHSNGIKLLGSAFRVNSSLTDLHLRGMADDYIVAILAGLERSRNSRIENLNLIMDEPSSATCRALQRLLMSAAASTFQTLRLERCILTGDTFEVLTRGIRQSKTASTILFFGCSFDLEAAVLFERAFQKASSNWMIANLELSRYAAFAKPTASVLTNILGPSSLLKELTLTGQFCWELTAADIATLLNAVEQSPALQFLLMANVDNYEDKCRALATGLTKLRWLKTFHFSVPLNRMGDDVK